MADTFTTDLEVRELDDNSNDGRGTWQLIAPLAFLSALWGLLTVPAGFVTDFASVPRLPLVFFLLGGIAHRAAVLHDWLYTNHLFSRAQSDAVLRAAAIASGVPAWKAWALWAGVRIGGWHAWNADGQAQPAAVLA